MKSFTKTCNNKHILKIQRVGELGKHASCVKIVFKSFRQVKFGPNYLVAPNWCNISNIIAFPRIL